MTYEEQKSKLTKILKGSEGFMSDEAKAQAILVSGFSFVDKNTEVVISREDYNKLLSFVNEDKAREIAQEVFQSKYAETRKAIVSEVLRSVRKLCGEVNYRLLCVAYDIEPEQEKEND